LTGLLGDTRLKKKPDEDLYVYVERVRATLADRWAKVEGGRAKRELRAFLLLLLSQLLFMMKNIRVSLRYLAVVGKL